MRSSTIKAKLAINQPVFITQLHLNEPSIYEMASRMGFDGLWMDLEHHRRSLESASHLIRASRVGNSDIIARPAKGEFMRLGRLLEAGAQGIMYPRCCDAEEAAEVVRWAKFAPMGSRGFDGSGPDSSYGAYSIKEYLQHANKETFIIIQLEDQNSIDQSHEIAAVDGVDALMLGPADFTVLAGIPGEFSHSMVKEATIRISEAARAAGKHWGMPVFSDEHYRSLYKMGGRLFFHGADVVLLRQGLLALKQRFLELEASCVTRSE